MRKMWLALALIVLCALANAMDVDQVRTRAVIPGDARLAPLGLKKMWHTQVPVQWPRESVNNVVVAGDTLLVHSQTGSVTALDAENGATRWSYQPVSTARLVSVKPALNDHFAFVYDGDQVAVLDRKLGSVQHRINLHSVPIQSLTAANGTLCIAMPSGHVRVYRIPIPGANTDNTYVMSADQVAIKHPVVSWNLKYDRALLREPVILSDRILLPRATEELIVLDRISGREWERIPAKGLDSQVSSCSNSAYFGNCEGLVSAVESNEQTSTAWSVHLGSRLLGDPLAVGDDLYVVTERAGLHSLNRKSSHVQWKASGVTQVLSASPRAVYAMNRLHHLVSMDRKSGSPLGSLDMGSFRVPVSNHCHDRLYLANHDGVVLALRDGSAACECATMHHKPVSPKNPYLESAKAASAEAKKEPAKEAGESKPLSKTHEKGDKMDQ